jgi:hypothetical protein
MSFLQRESEHQASGRCLPPLVEDGLKTILVAEDCIPKATNIAITKGIGANDETNIKKKFVK